MRPIRIKRLTSSPFSKYSNTRTIRKASSTSRKNVSRSGGYISLSVPNRGRWQKGVETLDYPPNHLTRWSPLALRNFLEKNGFEVLSMKEEPLNIRRAAQVLSMGLRTGLVAKIAGEQAAISIRSGSDAPEPKWKKRWTG